MNSLAEWWVGGSPCFSIGIQLPMCGSLLFSSFSLFILPFSPSFVDIVFEMDWLINIQTTTTEKIHAHAGTHKRQTTGKKQS